MKKRIKRLKKTMMKEEKMKIWKKIAIYKNLQQNKTKFQVAILHYLLPKKC
jgi:hypothetical protein